MSSTVPAVQICATYPPRVCGIAEYTSRLAEGIRSQGVPVTVVTAHGEAPESVNLRPIVSDWGTAGVQALVAELVALRPGVVHLQWERAIYQQSRAVCFLLPRALRRAGIPLVTTFHSLDGPKSWGKLHRLALIPLLLGSADRVVCSLRQSAALKKIPLLGSRSHLIPVGPNVEPSEDIMEARSKRAVGVAKRLVYFGFVWRGRNIELLLRTLATLPPQTTLDILGGVSDAEYHAELLALSHSLGVSERICFRPDLPEPELSRYLLQADIALLPFSTGVSTGRGTLMAALAHHLPVVTMSATDNLSPLFVDGENMRIAAAENEAGFTTAVQELAADGALRNRLMDGAARLAREFSWSAIARATLALPAYQGIAR